MTQLDKLIKRLLTFPTDFSWIELKKILLSLGYKQSHAGKTSGSRVRFIHNDFEPIILHKPHPTSILKGYQLKQIITALQDRGVI